MKHIKYTFAVVVLLFGSCNSYNTVKNNRIQFYWPKETSFEISELIVDSIGVKGLPLRYTEKDKVVCLPANKIVSEGLNYSEEFKPQKKIYFNRVNKYYKWSSNEVDSTLVLDVCPIRFEKLKWYKLSGFPEHNIDDYRYNIFVYRKGNGSLKVKHSFKGIFEL